MKVYVVTNDCAFIVGVFDNEGAARAARIIAEMDGVVDPFIQQVELNQVFTGVEIE